MHLLTEREHESTPLTPTAQMSATSEPPAWWKAIKPFVNGGTSGMLATSIIQPIDLVKVRIQLGATGNPVSEQFRSSSSACQAFGQYEPMHGVCFGVLGQHK